MTTKEDIFRQLQKRVAEEMCIPEHELSTITLETDVVADLKADELDAVECVMAIEEEFGILIPEEDMETYHMNSSVFKIKDAVDYIFSRLVGPQSK